MNSNARHVRKRKDRGSGAGLHELVRPCAFGHLCRVLWYWHRLRAMGPAEIAAHARKKIFQYLYARGMPDGPSPELDSTVDFPKLPRPEDAPAILREALTRDAKDILAGRWKA